MSRRTFVSFQVLGKGADFIGVEDDDGAVHRNVVRLDAIDNVYVFGDGKNFSVDIHVRGEADRGTPACRIEGVSEEFAQRLVAAIIDRRGFPFRFDDPKEAE
jgi:hypothetical protein